MNLDPADAAELADLLQFIVGWLASDREHTASSLLHYAGDVPTAPASSTWTWTASPPSSERTTANHSPGTTGTTCRTLPGGGHFKPPHHRETTIGWAT